MVRLAHYSRVFDDPCTLNVVTGRSIYYGMRPHRCDDRFQDWLAALLKVDNIGLQLSLFQTFWRCVRSNVGEEPLDDYYRLGSSEVAFYAERYRSGMMREKLWETYPYDQNEVRRIAEEDAMKMRVWRHQRQLELQAKEAKLDSFLQANILGRNAKSL